MKKIIYVKPHKRNGKRVRGHKRVIETNPIKTKIIKEEMMLSEALKQIVSEASFNEITGLTKDNSDVRNFEIFIDSQDSWEIVEGLNDVQFEEFGNMLHEKMVEYYDLNENDKYELDYYGTDGKLEMKIYEGW